MGNVDKRVHRTRIFTKLMKEMIFHHFEGDIGVKDDKTLFSMILVWLACQAKDLIEAIRDVDPGEHDDLADEMKKLFAAAVTSHGKDFESKIEHFYEQTKNDLFLI